METKPASHALEWQIGEVMVIAMVAVQERLLQSQVGSSH